MNFIYTWETTLFHLDWGGAFLQVQSTTIWFKSSNLITHLQIITRQLLAQNWYFWEIFLHFKAKGSCQKHPQGEVECKDFFIGGSSF